ncbi:MAG: ThiF family adenylyltransferase [Chloroherpetonaceae bacterium]|nr:ThiF family adenylyltransferase [Chloroherpetonaceae bacterium]MDW8438592.1 ThiF family adenylyltransferase [Chloroherpetonaceae bacterium]
MKPKVYLCEENLRALIRGAKKNPATVFVKEHRGEDVFHVLFGDDARQASSETIGKIYLAPSSEKIAQALSEFEALDASKQSVLGAFVEIDGENVRAARARLKRGLDVVECDLHFVPLKSDLYSRSKGLLETDALARKRAMIIGLGSFGSTIAVELAKAGVGNFVLMDFDRLDVSNVARHACGLNDLGRYKTRAVRDLILAKNPFANVETIERDVRECDALADLMDGAHVVICATDNNRSRFLINETALKTGTTVIYGRAFTRAEAGDVFIVNGKIAESDACYNCLVGLHHIEEEISSARQTENLPAYVAPEEREARIQVGLSSDILPICNMMVKLALLELTALDDDSPAMRELRSELTYNYYFWANRREKIFRAFEPFNDAKGLPTILKWHGALIEKNKQCWACGSPELMLEELKKGINGQELPV